MRVLIDTPGLSMCRQKYTLSNLKLHLVRNSSTLQKVKNFPRSCEKIQIFIQCKTTKEWELCLVLVWYRFLNFIISNYQYKHWSLTEVVCSPLSFHLICYECHILTFIADSLISWEIACVLTIITCATIKTMVKIFCWLKLFCNQQNSMTDTHYYIIMQHAISKDFITSSEKLTKCYDMLWMGYCGVA